MQVEFKKLDKKIKHIWLIKGGIGALITLVIYTLSCFGSLEAGILLPMLISGGIVVLLIIFLCIGMPLLRYHYYSYGFDDKRIFINSGVIFKHRIVIPVCQIQDLHLVQGPLMLIFKLGGIIISTAGSNHAISGLDLDVAKEMLEKLELNLEARVEALKDE